MPDMSILERLLSYYGFPVAFSAGLLVIIWRVLAMVWKKAEPMIDALTDYFLGLPEYEQKKMAVIEESRAIAIETRERTKRIEASVGKIKTRVLSRDDDEKDDQP